ncbi:hypothetical protein Tco_0045268 [Tanacetum coccineum]
MVRRKEEAKEQYKEEDEMGTAEEVKELSEDEERASQSRQHGKSELASYYLPDSADNSCSGFLCLDTLVRLPMDIRLKIDLEN